jgi:hypothetical protein
MTGQPSLLAARFFAFAALLAATFAACQQGAVPSDSSGTTTTQASSGSEPAESPATDPDAGP